MTQLHPGSRCWYRQTCRGGYGYQRDVQAGMSLRDYFAGQALAGLLARSDLGVPHCPECRQHRDDPGEHYADISYRYADAMLMAREGER